MKLALGTVQFGMPYGISNKNGQVSRSEAKAIIHFARTNGIDTLDTAIGYGESESCLGQIGTDGFRLISKLPSCPENVDNISSWVSEQVEGSLSRLGVSSIYGLMLHCPEQLLVQSRRDLVSSMQEIKAAGLVKKIGISIYSPSELDALYGRFPLDLVQAPFSIVDQRLFNSGWMQRLADDGVEIHVRSVFLQGLLLMPRKDIPENFYRWASIWDNWHTWLEDEQVSAVQACLQFAKSFHEIDRIVTGVETVQQLAQLVDVLLESSKLEWPDIASRDEQLINPVFWNLI